MRIIKLLSLGVVLTCGIISCGSNDNAKANVDNLSMYVDSVTNLTPVYTSEKWASINDGYNMKINEVESKSNELNENEKAEFEKTKQKYASLKADYETKMNEAKSAAANTTAPDSKMTLRNSLFGEGKIGTDMSFGFVTAENILGVYDNFVTTVDANQNKYSREDWDEIKVLYEALDTRKNEVEKDLATKDNLKIAKLKIKFAALKSVKRPFSKVEENVESKN